MKKAIVAATLIAGMALSAPVYAYWGNGQGQGGNRCGTQMVQQNPEMKAKITQFFKDNLELRKQMVMKQAEKRALMRAATPDSKAVAQVVGELFDLRVALMTKADEAGLSDFMGPGMGLGMGHGRMGGKKMGRFGMGPGMMGGHGGNFQNYPCNTQQ